MSTPTPPPASPAPAARPVIDPARLKVDQLRGLNCAYCDARLYRANFADVVRVGEGVHAQDVQLYACAPACRPRPILLVPHAWCRFCHNPISEADAVVIGCIEVSSGPGRPIYADGKCVVAYRVIPLAEHPEGSNGSIRYRDRSAIVPPPR